ncbi:MAG: hypothetical protein ACKV22_18590 [Bryobacteraceae bacterium]
MEPARFDRLKDPARSPAQTAGEGSAQTLEVHVPLSDLGDQVSRLGQSIQALPGADGLKTVLQQLQAVLGKALTLALPPQMNTRSALGMMGVAGQTEQLLHRSLSPASRQTMGKGPQTEGLAQIAQLIGQILSTLQGRPGLSPHGYAPGSFGLPAQKQAAAGTPVPQPQVSNTSTQERTAQAEQLKKSGALGNGEEGKSKQPPLTGAERKSLDEIICKANDDTAAALSQNAKAMGGATPEQKAKLVRELMSGHTSDSEDQAIARILQSCTSKAEYDKVLAMAGGKDAVLKELDDKGAKSLLCQVHAKWESEQKEAAGKAIGLLEQCQSPEEAKELATQLGGTELKHKVKDPEQLKRLEAVAKRFEMPALAYGVAPGAVGQTRASVNQAITKQDSDLATKLAEDKDAMKVASPSEKAGLIKELMRGWTKDRQDVAVYKILSSCTSKAQFDQVMELSGGREVLKDMDHAETRTKMDQLFGAWDRVDLADDKKRAGQFQGVMADPQKQADLSATRPPTGAEVNQVGGSFKLDAKDANDPLMQQAGQAAGAVQKSIQSKAFDIDWDPQAKTELVLEQRKREVEGKPKLDWTKLTAEADKITSDPDFAKNVQAFQKQYNESSPLDKLDDKEAREKYVTLHMEKLAKQNGLSEQTMKSLVTQRMGQIYHEGAGEMSGYSEAIAGPMKKELARIEETKGPNSPEAAELRERIAKFDKATSAYTNHLGSIGTVYKDMFPVPASFWEGFVSAFSFISDIAAAVASCIPGVGQAIGATYFGVKAVVAAAKGDVLGMFSSVASALPGLGSAIGGAAGAAVKTAGRAMQTGIGVGAGIADGNVLGALGSVAGAGAGISPVLDYAQRGLKLADGISRGDVSAIAGAAGDVLGPLSNNPAVQGIVRNPVVQGVAQATGQAVPFLDAIARGDMSQALGAVAGQLGPLANDGAAFVDALRSGNYGKVLGEMGSSLNQMGAGPEAAALVQSFNQVSDVLSALASGNPRQMVAVLQGPGGVLEQLAGGGLSNAFAGVSNVARQTLDTPQLRAARDLTTTGTRFLRAVGSGELNNHLAAAWGDPHVAELSRWLESAQPLVQSMENGSYRQAIDELRKSPVTADAAGRMERLSPLAELAQADFVKSLEESIANLDRLAKMGHELHRFKDLEEAARQLKKRFGEGLDSMGQHLLDRSGFGGPAFGTRELVPNSARFGPLR